MYPSAAGRRRVVLDIGASATLLQILEGDCLLESALIAVGGDAVDEAITSHVRDQFGIDISRRCAEAAKLMLGGQANPERSRLALKGRRRGTSEPVTADVDDATLGTAALRAMRPVIEAVREAAARWTLTDSPMSPSLEARGGGAHLQGLRSLLELAAAGRAD